MTELAEHALSAIERAAWHAIHHPHHYHDSNTPTEAPMSLLDTIRTEITSAVTWGEDELRAKLPTIARIADDAEAVANSNAARAVLAAVLSPEDEAFIVGMVQRLDQRADTAAQAAAGSAVPPGAVPIPAQTDLMAAVPAGPVVGGQA